MKKRSMPLIGAVALVVLVVLVTYCALDFMHNSQVESPKGNQSSQDQKKTDSPSGGVKHKVESEFSTRADGSIVCTEAGAPGQMTAVTYTKPGSEEPITIRCGDQ